MTTKKVDFRTEQVHRTAFAVRAAAGFAEQLGHYRFRRDTFGDGLSMFSVTGDYVIVVADGGNGADANCFLADVQMTETANLSQTVRLGTLLFEATNQQHLMKELHQRLA